MRLLVISNLYPSPAHPAFGSFVESRVEALRSIGVDVQVVANFDPAVHHRVIRKYLDLAVMAGLGSTRARLRRQRIDVVEAHIAYPTGLIARPAAAFLGAPLVLFAHGADVELVSLRSGLHARLARATFDSASLIIANSVFLADQIKRRYPHVAGRVRVLSPGIDLDRFKAGEVTTRRGVLFVGRLTGTKGVEVLVRAIAALRAAPGAPAVVAGPVVVIGDGPERGAIKTLAANLGVDLDMRGEVDRYGVAQAMQGAAVVAIPSIGRESLGLVAIEAMAAGAIVVASRLGGLEETVLDGVTGLIVSPSDVLALARAIHRAGEIAAEPVAGSEMRAAGRAMAATHDRLRSATDTVALYDNLRR